MSFKNLAIHRLLFVVVFCTSTHALLSHEIRPAYFEIREVAEQQFQVRWKLPVLQGRVPLIEPQFSISHQITDQSERLTDVAMTQTFLLQTINPLHGTKVEFSNLEKTLIDVVVSIDFLSGEKHILLVQPDHPSVIIPVHRNSWQVARTFGILGIEHILLGWDHLLFVLALVLLIENWVKLVKAVTAFTIAHSITLIGTSLQMMSLPSAPVETVIALSVVFLAREYVMYRRGKESITRNHPWVIAFSFGLLHGFGFAGALSSIGLPEHALFSALLSFNLGVEIGQLLFIAMIVSLSWIFNKALKMTVPSWSNLAMGYAIGSIASFWFVTRLFDIVI